jgi:aminoglycoside phosphotransferase (APT) family kinase protein
MGNLAVLGDEITGVLDWEMAAPDDPLADLAWCFIPVWEPAGVDGASLVARYEDRSGQPVDRGERSGELVGISHRTPPTSQRTAPPGDRPRPAPGRP